MQAEFGVHQRDARQQVVAADAGLELFFHAGDDGVARDFRSRARGGGHGDPGRGGARDLPAPADDLHVIERLAAVGQQAGDGLGGIERAAAAQRDAAVALRLPRGQHAAVHVFRARFACDAEYRVRHALGGEQVRQAREQAQLAGAVGIGHHQRFAAEFGGQFAEALELAASEKYAAHAGEFELSEDMAARSCCSIANRKSKLLAVSKEQAVMLHPLARRGHPRGDPLLPAQVMRRLLVRDEILLGAVRFVEQETGRVVLGLQDIEAQIARLLARVPRVVERGRDEGLNVLRLDEDVTLTTYIAAPPFPWNLRACPAYIL